MKTKLRFLTKSQELHLIANSLKLGELWQKLFMPDIEAPYMGTEVEYAVYSDRLDPEAICRLLFRAVKLPGRHASINFITERGARAYIDVGSHPEYSTPDCLTANDVKVEEMRGEEFYASGFSNMVAYFEEYYISRKPGPLKAILSKKNVARTIDQTLDKAAVAGKTWGVHENHQAIKEEVLTPIGIESFSAYNITRLPLTGAGGFVGNEYWISPRAFFHVEEANNCTTGNRPIFHFRPERLVWSEEFMRVHNITSEGNMSPWQIHIKVGSAALALRAIESGVYFDDLHPQSAVETFQAIGKDNSLKYQYQAKSGKGYTALAAQRIILERVRPFAVTEDDLLVLDEWEQGINELERLASDNMSSRFVYSMDWFAKWRRIEGKKDVANPRDVDFEYAKIIDQNGQRGLGHSMRERGMYRLTPSEWAAKPSVDTPTSPRAKIRGALAVHPAVLAIDWTKFRLNPDVYPHLLAIPDRPTPEDEQLISELIAALPTEIEAA